MYTYINTKTGASFESNSVCAGGDWVMLNQPANAEKPKQTEKKPKQAEKKSKKGK